jgi:hypothetical protein
MSVSTDDLGTFADGDTLSKEAVDAPQRQRRIVLWQDAPVLKNSD